MALRTYLTGIADAIREKKGTSDPINAQDFASEIASISTGGGGSTGFTLQDLVDGKGIYGGQYLCYYYRGTNVDFLSNIDFSNTTTMSYMFAFCKQLPTIPQFDTSNVTEMKYMFHHAEKLTTISLLNTSKVDDMTNMFDYCYELTTIPQLDTSKVTEMRSVFSSCNKLTTVPQLDTSSATDMTSMFRSCHILPTIDITQLANSNTSFAQDCYSLTKLIIRTMNTIPTSGSKIFQNCYHMTGTVNSTYNPDGLQDGRIYVPDDKVDALKAATGWANFADVIVPLSTLVED